VELLPRSSDTSRAPSQARDNAKTRSLGRCSTCYSYHAAPAEQTAMSKPTIPAWQRTATSDAPSLAAEEQPTPENAAEDSTKPVAEEPAGPETTEQEAQSKELLAQASRFLEDVNIRDAPREKKAVFLQAKGVSSEDIETLLGKATDGDASPDLEEAGARAWSTVSSLVPCCAIASKALDLTNPDTSQSSRKVARTFTSTSRNTSNRHIS